MADAGRATPRSSGGHGHAIRGRNGRAERGLQIVLGTENRVVPRERFEVRSGPGSVAANSTGSSATTSGSGSTSPARATWSAVAASSTGSSGTAGSGSTSPTRATGSTIDTAPRPGRCSSSHAGQRNHGNGRGCGRATERERAAARPGVGADDAEFDQPGHWCSKAIGHQVGSAAGKLERIGLIAGEVEHVIVAGSEDQIAIVEGLDMEVFAERERHGDIPSACIGRDPATSFPDHARRPE
ncbi:MAG: hypothetical protein JST73_06320 [Actinobacteria bacterium]|nr:hypothetical protein [Actinomycetota bacterium]